MGPSLVGSSPPVSDPFVRHRLGIVGALVALSVLVALGTGIPDRPYLVIWMGLLALAVTWRNPARWARVVLDWLPILIIVAGYDLVRSFSADLIPRAMTRPQLRFDELLFGGRAPTVALQDALVDRGTPHWWDYLAWLVYLSHFVVTPAIAVWLYARRRDWFRRYRVLIPVVSVAGFVTYFVIPVVPPWMASRDGVLPHTVRIVYLVWDHLGIDSVADIFSGNTRLANPVAALPSLHAAWPFLTLLFFWNRLPRIRAILLAYNAVMITVLVYGAEHYVSDILLGWAYASVVYVVVSRVLDRRGDRAHADPELPDVQRRASARICS